MHIFIKTFQASRIAWHMPSYRLHSLTHRMKYLSSSKKAMNVKEIRPGIFWFFLFRYLLLQFMHVFVFLRPFLFSLLYVLKRNKWKISFYPCLSLLAVLYGKIKRNSLHTLCVINTCSIFFYSYYYEEYSHVLCWTWREKESETRGKKFKKIFLYKMDIIII